MRFWFASFFFITYFNIFSQGFGEQNWTDKFYTGGGMGLNLGSDFISVSASPILGYKITSQFSAGVGITYQYTEYKKPVDLNLSHYGGSIFSRFQFTEQYFAYTEYEFLTIEYPVVIATKETDREGYSSLFVGGGYAYPLGRNAVFVTTFLYNLLWEDGVNSPYNSPVVIRAGINLGF